MRILWSDVKLELINIGEGEPGWRWRWARREFVAQLANSIAVSIVTSSDVSEHTIKIQVAVITYVDRLDTWSGILLNPIISAPFYV